MKKTTLFLRKEFSCKGGLLLAFSIMLIFSSALYADESTTSPSTCSAECFICHKNIKGKYYYDAKGNMACKSHLKKREVQYCSFCEDLVENYIYLKDFTVTCGACLDTIDKCMKCKLPICGGYYVDIQGNSLCESHVERETVDYCYGCLSYLTGGTISTPDGRVLCESCYTTVVGCNANTDEIVDEVLSYMSEWNLEVDRSKFEVKVLSIYDMAERCGYDLNYKEPNYTLTSSSETRRRVVDDDDLNCEVKWMSNTVIYMLEFQPRYLFASNLAYELMNIWLKENNLYKGFKYADALCTLVECIYLSSLDDPVANNLLRLYADEDFPTQAELFYSVLDAFLAHDFDKIIESCKNGDFTIFEAAE